MTEAAAKLRIFGICGRSGQGKTTLIEALLPWFHARGWVVNVVKHSHHSIDLEPPGKDSARYRAAGAGEVLIASPYRYAIVRELHDAPEPPLADLVARLTHSDLTLVEGFTREALPRIEVVRPGAGKDPLYRTDTAILAIATDDALGLHDVPARPLLPLADIDCIGEFICKTVGLSLLNVGTTDV
ncbi:molybdopterin-guanine dinucleotide biosynthesis protein B [Caballeronia mineralivorans]|uniref:molybdopterin-guanine dinucleotide biosynthesis protein B n=1 Tax=Caballeronia mineralivorans TaxID=2010198 RepID=UPI002AFE7B91|nr:molybdopterin-guanine dinucleotide biosynthesis protein B [Caballeronia mineralivorans]MEA3101762.1 molybdopterin-guanine dinucleotide biosynthesis adapter protein [Caballeronia mineralivorans]